MVVVSPALSTAVTVNVALRFCTEVLIGVPLGTVPTHEAIPDPASLHEYEAVTVLPTRYVLPLAGRLIVMLGGVVSGSGLIVHVYVAGDASVRPAAVALTWNVCVVLLSPV